MTYRLASKLEPIWPLLWFVLMVCFPIPVAVIIHNKHNILLRRSFVQAMSIPESVLML